MSPEDYRREAIEKAERRGHKLGKWSEVLAGDRFARCKTCGAGVFAAAANNAGSALPVGGEAIRQECS